MNLTRTVVNEGGANKGTQLSGVNFLGINIPTHLVSVCFCVIYTLKRLTYISEHDNFQ